MASPTREQIVTAICRWANEHEHKPPREKDWWRTNRPAYAPPPSAVRRCFGSWPNAVEAAGFRRPRHGRAPDEALPALCREIHAKREAGALVEDLAREYGVSTWTIEVRLRRAQGEAEHPLGVRDRVRRRAIQAGWEEGLSATEIGEMFVMSRSHVTPIMTQMRAEGWDLPHRGAQPNRENRRGRRPTVRRAHRRWTNEHILEALIAHHTNHGCWPKSQDWRLKDPERQRPAASIVKQRFGTWGAAIKAAQERMSAS